MTTFVISKPKFDLDTKLLISKPIFLFTQIIKNQFRYLLIFGGLRCYLVRANVGKKNKRKPQKVTIRLIFELNWDHIPSLNRSLTQLYFVFRVFVTLFFITNIFVVFYLLTDGCSHGSWESGLSYECRSLLFKALHNLIER